MSVVFGLPVLGLNTFGAIWWNLHLGRLCLGRYNITRKAIWILDSFFKNAVLKYTQWKSEGGMVT